jgi:hypothetical protein
VRSGDILPTSGYRSGIVERIHCKVDVEVWPAEMVRARQRHVRQLADRRLS